MKTKYTLLTTLIVFSVVSYSVAQFQHPLQWERVIGGTKSEISIWYWGAANDYFANTHKLMAVDETDNIFLLTGSLSGIGGDKTTPHCGNVNQPDYWLVKMDPNGNILWERNIGGQNLDMPNSILLDEARSCMYLVGCSKSPPSCNKTDTTKGKEDIWIVKLDWNGNIIWDKSYGGLEVEAPRTAVLTANGDLFCAGASTSYLAGGGNIPSTGWTAMADMWGFMIDSSGAILWNRWIGADAGWDYIEHAFYRAGKILLTGYTNAWQNGTRDITMASHGLDDGWALMLDTTGIKLWDRTLGGTKTEQFTCGYIDDSGNTYVVGWVDGQAQNGDVTDSLRGSFDIWLLKLDSIGQIVENKLFGGDSLDYGLKVFENHDNIYILSWSISDQNDQKSEPRIGGAREHWILALDTSLNIVWDEVVGTLDRFSEVADCYPTLDSGLVLARVVVDTSGGDFTLQCWDTINYTSDIWLMKFAPVTTTGLSAATGLPGQQLKCYPNPAENVLQLGETEEGLVELFNLQGQPLQTWQVGAGVSQYDVPIEKLPEGMYIVRNGRRQCRVVKM